MKKYEKMSREELIKALAQDVETESEEARTEFVESTKTLNINSPYVAEEAKEAEKKDPLTAAIEQLIDRKKIAQ